MVIGVAGKYAAGKNQVVRILTDALDAFVIDVDALGHEALLEKRDEVIRGFGAAVQAPDGNIDRKKLGAVVFADDTELAKLERITHPVMRDKVKQLIDGLPGQTVIINAALLFHMGLHPLCDTVIWTTARRNTSIRRGMERDGLSRRHAAGRLQSNRKLKPQQCLKNTDIYIIRNNSTLEALNRKVYNFIELKGMR